jgi:phage tail-like protein
MIDVNQQRFFIFSNEKQFDLEGQANSVEWNDALQVLRLRSTRTLENIPTNRQRTRELADQPPVTLDAFGTWARVDETGGTILAGGVFPDPIAIHALPAGERIVDMAMNPEGVLYVIGKDDRNISTIYLINRRGARDDGRTAFLDSDEEPVDTNIVTVNLPEGENRPDRIVALSRGGALLLDREKKVFWEIVGKPLRAQPTAIYSPETPRPCPDGPRPQKLIERPDLILPADYEALDMASNLTNETAVLLYPEASDKPAAVVLISDKGISAPVFLDKAIAPYSIGWIGEDGWALLFEDKKEAFVYPIPWLEKTPDEPVRVSGRRYPLNWGADDEGKNRKFVNGLSRPVYYQSTDKQKHFLLRPLYSLSYPSYATNAVVKTTNLIDSGEPNTVWHRLFLEAHIPKGTGVIVYLAAGEDRDALENEPAWAEHHFGSVPVKPDIPRGVWFNDTSEVPFFKGLLYCRPQAGTAGVFDVLVQRAGYAERSVRGRYLNVKIELTGGGQSSPEVSALRIYHPRFSYLDRYLPELYRETNAGQKSNERGAACGSDFLRRFLCLFESVLTPMEGKVAASHMLTNPASAPAEALDWLGQWIGLGENIDLTEKQKRLYIQNATSLYRKRGTMKGLALALNLITGNWVSRGDIVLLEDFRLRRTFATILGADFSVEDDPLLMGRIPNANSYLGETMFLGEEEKKEFLALYAQDIPLNLEEQEQETIDSFYARLANRLTVLVHQNTDAGTLGLINRVVGMEAPSHIDFRVVPASKPLLIGMYSLLGVDTYMREEPERRTARVGHSYLGRYDFIRKLPVLDDRLEP